MGDLWKNFRALFRSSQGEKAQEEAVANVSMNDGDHGTIFGFNRNIILGIFLAACSITAIAIIFATDEPAKEEKQVPAREQHAASANAGKNEVNQFAMGYEELVKANQQYGKGSPQQGRGNGSGQLSQNHRQEQPTAAIPPTSLPTVPQVPVPVTVQQSEEDKEAAAYLQRMKSPIAFGVSGSGNTGNAQMSGETGETGKFGDAPAETTASLGGAAAPLQQNAAAYIAPGKYTLQAGTIIPVVLCTGINSDIGGQVVAQVQQDMYDTATGRNLLIPAGSKILGTYGKGSPNNSGRVEITFTSIVLPDGGSFAVGDALVAVDGAGYSGISGKVDRHTNSTLSAGMFSSALAALGSVAAGNTSNTSNTYSAGQLAMQGAMANMMNTASQLFQQGANRQMTVTAKPGTFFSVYVTQGLTLQRGGAR